MISVIILTKNEERNIEKCLVSVKWCDEVIILDDMSSDKTVEIAKKFKAKIFLHALGSDFSAQRNFGLSKAQNEWVLFVDADEIVSDALAYEMQNAIGLKDQNLNDFDGFYIKRVDFIWGKQLKYGETGNIKLLRLAKKNCGPWEGKAHERWCINGETTDLVNPIFHSPHKSLDEFLGEINFYTDIKAKELKDKNLKSYFWSIILFPSGKFLINYFLKRGFLDGMAGLIFATIMSFHSFLVRGKLWILQHD
jgi:glycosyltransferase involved in cell wall biosynthesis